MSPEEAAEVLAGLAPEQLEAFNSDWEVWARTAQLEPEGAWLDWLLLAGRGFGKTRTAAEWSRRQMESMPGSRGIIVAPTFPVGRDVCVEGESGLLACFPSSVRQHIRWNRSIGEMRHPNGSRAKLYAAVEPDGLRGAQSHWMWAEELAAWKKSWAAWDQAKLGLRLKYKGRESRCVISTTPRPVKIIRDLVKSPTSVVTRGSTYENLAHLSAAYRDIIAKYKGTRLGRQELNGEVLDDTPGALWTRALIESCRVEMPPLRQSRGGEEEFDFVRVVVAIDPATTTNEDSDETGIVVAARAANGKRYVLEDLSGRHKPHEWAAIALDAFERWGADRIVAETNQGGEMVEAVLRAEARGRPAGKRHYAYRSVSASRGKQARAEPVSTAYERGEVHHVGAFEHLEDQLCVWVPGSGGASPDRLDALVWAWTELERHAVTVV